MSADPFEGLLRNADDSAPKVDLRPPLLADLELRRRRQLVRRGGALLALAILATSALWLSAIRDRHRAELLNHSAQSLTGSLAELGDALASLHVEREPTVSTASEDAAMVTFRALHRGADRGDPESIEGMRWLARRFSTTRGGRCAQLFLNAQTDETNR